MERVYIKYDSNNKLPTHESILPNHRDKEVNALASYFCVTTKANQNLNPSQKEIIRCHFRLGHIGFHPVKWLVRTKLLKVQLNSKALANCESANCNDC